MNLSRSIPAFAAISVLGALGHSAANAQLGSIFGQVNLPTSDFTWFWGNQRDADLGRASDFSVSGSDTGFLCELTGRLGAGSRLSSMEVRSLENDLRTSSFFIQAVANTMYTLDQQRDIRWAKLVCAKPEAAELDS